MTDVGKVEQRSYIKIAFLHGKNACEYYAELWEALGDRTLPYQTVARWVEAFKRGHVATVDLLYSECPESARTEEYVAVMNTV